MATPAAATSAMASSSPVVVFGRQTWALTRKNLIHLVMRRWLSTAIQCLILPIVLIGVFTNIQNFARPKSVYGFGTPSTIRAFEDSLSDGRDFLVVANSSQGRDVRAVVQGLQDRVAKRGNKFVTVEQWQDMESRCIVNRQGFSNCHSAVWFKDCEFVHRSRGPSLQSTPPFYVPWLTPKLPFSPNSPIEPPEWEWQLVLQHPSGPWDSLLDDFRYFRLRLR